jgi:probable rRNA maturation factor
LGCPDAELSILLTDDATIQQLNRQWRGKDRPTDVLSFSQVEIPRGASPTPGSTPRGKAIDPALLGPHPNLGDIVISLDTAERQAPRYAHPLDAELERLLVHGILHLLGHDHIHGGPQSRLMKREEARLLAALHLPPPKQSAIAGAPPRPRSPRRRPRRRA